MRCLAFVDLLAKTSADESEISFNPDQTEVDLKFDDDESSSVGSGNSLNVLDQPDMPVILHSGFRANIRQC